MLMPMYPYLGYKMQSGIKLPSPKWLPITHKLIDSFVM